MEENVLRDSESGHPLSKPLNYNHSSRNFAPGGPVLTKMADASSGTSSTRVYFVTHVEFTGTRLSLPATFQLPAHLVDVAILAHFIVCATPRLTTTAMFTEYLQRVTNQQVSTQDVVELATSLQRFLHSDCQLVSCLEQAAWVRLCQNIRKVTLSLANQAPGVSPSPTQVALGALLALLGVTPQADNILDSASEAGSVIYRLSWTEDCAVQVFTQPLLMEPAWLRALVANPGVAGLLSGPPSAADAILDHVATATAVEEDVSRNILGNPYTIAVATGMPILPGPPSSGQITSANSDFTMIIDPVEMFDTSEGVKNWRPRVGIEHLRAQWRDHPDNPAHFGLAFDGGHPPKRQRTNDGAEWTRNAHCTACAAKAVLSASWDAPTICSVAFQGSCTHKHGITINQRVTGTARAKLRESTLKPMQLRGAEFKALPTKARQAGNLYGVPSKSAAKKISSERNHRFRLHKDPWTSLNLQQDASRSAHVTRHELAGLPPPKVSGSMHHLTRYPPSVTLTSEMKILLADGLLPQFPMQIDWSSNHMTECGED